MSEKIDITPDPSIILLLSGRQKEYLALRKKRQNKDKIA